MLVGAVTVEAAWSSLIAKTEGADANETGKLGWIGWTEWIEGTAWVD